MVRGIAEVQMLDDVVPEYALSAERYFGPEQGPAWVSANRGKPPAAISLQFVVPVDLVSGPATSVTRAMRYASLFRSPLLFSRPQ
jgi:hypothetical protein